MSAPAMAVKEDKISLPAYMEQRQPPCAVAALSIHAWLQTLINFSD